MAYIKKIIAKDENLIGIARLHWIYVVKGLAWFIVFGAAGWVMNTAITRVVMYLGSATGAQFLPAALMTISNYAMFFLLAGGFMIFLLFVIKVLVTEVGLSNRRVIHKEGLLFVKVHQIDIEEIRGENMDMGWFGRILDYGYLMLDCRFVGDVRLPAIENPERFLKALHVARGKSQDSLSLVVGKGNATPVNMDMVRPAQDQQPEVPQPSPPQPTPEIQPGTPGPEVTPEQPGEYPTQPVPHGPPPAAPIPAPQPQPEITPQPQQPVAPPPPSEPPLQPPSGQQQMQQPVPPLAPAPPAFAASEEIPQAAQQQQPPAQQQPQPQQPAATQAVDAKMIAQVVQQVMPQMAQQVARELVSQGVIDAPVQHNENVDTDLITSFDEAALDPDGKPHDHRDKLEHAIH